jgi:hypothetical protein
MIGLAGSPACTSMHRMNRTMPGVRGLRPGDRVRLLMRDQQVHREHLYPRQGHVLWVVAMVLALFS